MHPSSAIKAASLAALLCLGPACGGDVTVVEMQRVPGPAGAAMLTLDFVQLGDSQLLVAPTPQKLLVHDQQWTGVDSQLLPTFQIAPFQSMREILGESPFPRSRTFCAADGRVWFLGKPTPQDAPQLWMSLDAGRTFNPMELPNHDKEVPTDQAIRATDPFWLRCAGPQVYLLHSTGVWQFVEGDQTWRALDLTGLEFTAEGLPPVVRSYLPRHEKRPFELLTLLGDQLYFWRRTDPGEPWILTSTFGTAERDLIGHGLTDSLWMVTPDVVYQSDDQGEQWYRVSPPELKGIETIRAFDIDGVSVLLVGTSEGAIWRRDVEWSVAKPADSDGRTVTGFARRGDALWAATMGQGAFVSRDLGATWSRATEGDDYSPILDVEFAPNALLVATSSGAHERVLDERETSWQLLADRAATSIHTTTSGRILIGTRNGDVISGGSPNNVAGDLPAPLFEFSRVHGRLPAASVVEIRSVGDYVLALTHGAGAGYSSDGGQTWAPFEFAPALVSTLSSSLVTHLLFGEGGTTLYLGEKSDRRGTPTQLWRSTDSGVSWTAVEALQRAGDEGPVSIGWSSPGQPPLLAARGNEVLRSMDGDHWEVLDGPWRAARIIGMDVHSGHAAILAEVGARHVLYYLEAIDNPSNVERVVVSWPATEGFGQIRDVRIHRRRLYILTQDALLEGSLPLGAGPYGNSFASTVTAILVISAVGLAFAIVKRFGR